MKNKRIFVIAGIIGSVLGLLLILAFILYAWTNDSGHTGIHSYYALGLYVPLAFLGGFLLRASSKGNTEWNWGLAALLVGVMGMALLVYFDISGALLSYGMWADRHG